MDVVQVGQFIKERRKILGFTQNALAEYIGISPQAVSKWERGENMPDVGFFPDLAKFLEINIEDILQAGVGNAPKPKVKPKLGVDEQTFAAILKEPDEDYDIFAHLTSGQKMEYIITLINRKTIDMALDEILPYAGLAHRQVIFSHILSTQMYELLEETATFMSNDIKAQVLQNLLDNDRLDIVEDIVTTFNRKHRDMIIEYFLTTDADEDDVDNFRPFFDKNQIAKLAELEEK